MTRAFLGLGSNLEDRWGLLREAVVELPDVVAVSSVYETDPVGGPDQEPFLNLVVQLDTRRSPQELLELCREREAAANRIRVVRWGPRTLDVDVLWVDGHTVDTDELQVPHPRMTDRAFVMVPLGELAPDLVEGWIDPGTGEVRQVGSLFGDRRVRLVGPGRAGQSFAAALTRRGWRVEGLLGRDADLAAAAADVDLVLITTPDAAIADVARAIDPDPDVVVAHAAGSLGLEVLGAHARPGAIHPLVSLPNGELGARRLLDGAWFAVAGDPLMDELVQTLDGRSFGVADEHRAVYHAAACVASNHLVALLGQVERLADSIAVPFDAYLALATATLENIGELGPAEALTGPAARGDLDTIERHRAALPPDERDAYDALVREARRLATWRS
ncbi:MAG: 2-amino-4-hydroxy-6-hydroxymethyldihydropteridine diphosphokinase [Acidimicrobiales bacterium]|nr:2-amino-4-hydroxy-6-hydroxymethyldihydropteridine diphosphokinase [Acidimicrobiales bacterium]